MKALQLQEYNRFEYLDLPEPAVGDDYVLVQVKSCGICGSDVHGMDGSTGRRIPLIIMSHEAAGVITKLGAKISSNWKVGDRVTFDSTVYCGSCYFCTRGEINLCDNRKVLGVSCGDYRQHGAYAELVAVPEPILYRLPENLAFEHAAMVEPVSIAFHAVNRLPKSISDSVVVVGAGMIGLFVIQALRLAGYGKIIAVDLDDNKLEMAKEFGTDFGLRSDEGDVISEIQKLTEGRGADTCLEVVGIGPTVDLALRAVKKGGRVCLVGNLKPKVEIPLQAIVTRELTVFGTCASRGEYPACLEMIARGTVKIGPMISAIVPLSESSAWFERLYKGEPGLMKVIVKTDLIAQ
jgi:L-iditol 2-dehydrogenase